MRQYVTTKFAPQAIGPYSQAVQAGNTIYISGQLPLNPETGKISEDFEEQVKQAIKNIQAILAEVNLSLDSIVKTTVYLQDLNDFDKMNRIYQEFFKESKPARVAIEAARIPKGARVEIDAIANDENK